MVLVAPKASPQGVWNPSGMGTGKLNSPSNVKDVEPIPDAVVARMAALIAKFDQEAADEIVDANGNGSATLVWYRNKPGGKPTRGRTNSAQNTVGVNRGTGSKVAKAATLYHEWKHLQDKKGKNGPPTTHAEEMDPCNHSEEFEAELLLLCALADCANDVTNTNPDITFGEKSCIDFKFAEIKWRAAKVLCIIGPIQSPELPTAFPGDFVWPTPPCTPEGC